MYNYLLSPHLTRCYGLLRTVLFKLYVFRLYYFSFVVCPSVLDDLPPLVAVASSSPCPDLLRVFNYIVKVRKIAAYLLREEMHVDFSSSMLMIALTVLRNGLARMMGGSYSSSPMSITFNLLECLICIWS